MLSQKDAYHFYWNISHARIYYSKDLECARSQPIDKSKRKILITLSFRRLW